MGEMADYYLEESMLQELEDELKAENMLDNYKAGTFYWTTIDGRQIHIKDMSTNHVENTLAMVLRKDNGCSSCDEALVIIFREELRRRKY